MPRRRRTPAEEILAALPPSQARLADVDDEAAQRVLDAYEDARARIVSDIERRWAATVGAGVEPTRGQLFAFTQDEELLRTLDVREGEIRGEAINSVIEGYNASVLEAYESAGFERAQIARQFPNVAAASFVLPPGIAEEIGINKAVQDNVRIAQDVRNRVSTAITSEALAGRGVGGIVRRITPIFEGNARRAELTSRYVVIKAYNEARLVNYKDIAVSLKRYNRRVYKMWLTSIDDRTCIYEGRTKVLISEGEKEIRDVVPGDMVLTHRDRYRRVTAVLVSPTTKRVLKFRLDDSRLKPPLQCTEDHLLRVERAGQLSWIPADEVRSESDRLLVAAAGCLVAVGIKSITEINPEVKLVYDLQVEEDESFTANGVVVHNCPICLALHGAIVDLDENFDLEATFATQRPPRGWPVANVMQEPPRHARCRCSLVPWVDGWTTENKVTPNGLRDLARRKADRLGMVRRNIRAFRRGASTAATVAGAAGTVFLVARGVRLLRDGTFRGALGAYLECAIGSRFIPRRPFGRRAPFQRPTIRPPIDGPEPPGPEPPGPEPPGPEPPGPPGTAPPGRPVGPRPRPPRPGGPQRRPVRRPRRTTHGTAPPRPLAVPPPVPAEAEGEAAPPTPPPPTLPPPGPPPSGAANARRTQVSPFPEEPDPVYLDEDNGVLPLRSHEDPSRIDVTRLTASGEFSGGALGGVQQKAAFRDQRGREVMVKYSYYGLIGDEGEPGFDSLAEDVANKLGRTLGLMHPETALLREGRRWGAVQQLYPLRAPDELARLFVSRPYSGLVMRENYTRELHDDHLRNSAFDWWIRQKDANNNNYILVDDPAGLPRFIGVDKSFSLQAIQPLVETTGPYWRGFWREQRRGARYDFHGADDLVMRIGSITDEQLDRWLQHEYRDLAPELQQYLPLIASRLKDGRDNIADVWGDLVRSIDVDYRRDNPRGPRRWWGLGRSPDRGGRSGRSGRSGTGDAYPGYEIYPRGTPTEIRASRDLASIEDILTTRLGMKSAWTGRVQVLRGVAPTLGVKDFNCSISINITEEADPVARWGTLIHEQIHAISFSHYGSERARRNAYVNWMPWEEAVVEKVTRMERAAVVGEVGQRSGRVVPSERDMAVLDKDNIYNVFIDRMEEIRTGLRMSEQEFYYAMLRVPMHKRERLAQQWVKERSKGLPRAQREEVARGFRRMQLSTLEDTRFPRPRAVPPRANVIRHPHPEFPEIPRPEPELRRQTVKLHEDLLRDTHEQTVAIGESSMLRKWAQENPRIGNIDEDDLLEVWASEHTELMRRVVSPDVSQVAIRIPHVAAMTKILEDGRFRSHVEGVPHKGDPTTRNWVAVRQDSERRMFGYEPGDPDPAPIYGYIGDREEAGPSTAGLGEHVNLDSYGFIRVELSDRVRSRTTFTADDTWYNTADYWESVRGDSPPLQRFAPRSASRRPLLMVPEPVDSPSGLVVPTEAWVWIHDLGAVAPRWYLIDRPRDIAGDRQVDTSRYLEAQIHGGVKVEDIERVVFTNPGELMRMVNDEHEAQLFSPAQIEAALQESAALELALERAGIPYVISTPGGSVPIRRRRR